MSLRPPESVRKLQATIRPGLPLARCRSGITLPTARASRVPDDFLLHACRRHYPGGILQTDVARLTWRTAAFPESQAGRLPHRPFRGLLNVHSRFGLHARQVPLGPSTPKTPMDSLPPPPLRLLPAGATSCRVGFVPTANRRLCTAY